MRKTRIILAIAALALVSCTVSELANDTAIIRPKGDVYTASFEQPDTKVYVDGNLNTLWTAGDEISIFTTTFNQHYKFDGNTGDDNGSFSEVSSSFFSGGSIPTVYAVYPYSESTSITSEGVITLDLPAVQNYAENSYGLGANTMVAVTENKSDKALCFKSLCGYVVVRLYGYATIKSITLTGNNGEKISGQATVAPVYGQAPSVAMSELAGTSINLDCGTGVELGKTREEATSFWFAVPPVTFTQGFTIRVTNIDGYSMEKTTHTERTVVRNIKNPLSPLWASYFPIEPNIVFEDDNFKAFCVEKYDRNGDNEISPSEVYSETSLFCEGRQIASLAGIQYFTKLRWLDCKNNLLSSLDVSKNTALTYLVCTYNQLTSLAVSNNKNLETLICTHNQLTSIDLSNNEALRVLGCAENQLSSLDVHCNTALESLTCSYNQLTSLDVRNNTSLTSLDCIYNAISYLDVSNNTALGHLSCASNRLTSLDLSKNTALDALWCYSNSLNVLDVSHNTALTVINCSTNLLTSLDVSNNSALEWLYCHTNQLSSLDLSNNAALEDLRCQSNLLTNLDVSNNTALTILWCHYNPYLTQIWLKTGQSIPTLRYDTDIATIYYKD